MPCGRFWSEGRSALDKTVRRPTELSAARGIFGVADVQRHPQTDYPQVLTLWANA